MQEEKNTAPDDEIDLREAFKVFSKRKWWFIGTVILVLIAGILYSYFQPAEYTATKKIDVRKDYTNLRLLELFPETAYIDSSVSFEDLPGIFETEEVFISVKDDENIPYGYKELLSSDRVKITADDTNNSLEVSVTAEDKKIAIDTLNTLVKTFDEYIEKLAMSDLENLFYEISLRIDEIKENNQVLGEKIEILEENLISLYAELDKYILEYNKELAGDLKNVGSEEITLYSPVIPPNEILHEINVSEKRALLYEEKIVDNGLQIMGLEDLNRQLELDSDRITNRLDIPGGDPTVTSRDNLIRNIVIVIILSVILGAIVVYVANLIIVLRKKEKKD